MSKISGSILAVGAVIIVVVAQMATGFEPPQRNSGFPAPEDIRAYGAFMTGTEAEIIIPKVEGLNGFILTDAFAVSGFRVFQDAGEGPVEIFFAGSVQLHRLSPVPGLPLIPGSTITILGSQGDRATLIGYVY